MPKDLYDAESHFMTEYFDSELNKWIAMDAAFGCFYTDGLEILSIEEIRKSIKNDSLLDIYVGIGFKKSHDKRIKYFLTKNMYRFEYYFDYSPGYSNEHSGIFKFIIEPEDSK